MEEIILELIEEIRPYINMDGGDIEYVKYEDDYLYIKLSGACADCLGQEDTINEGLFNMFKEKIPTLKGIINLPL